MKITEIITEGSGIRFTNSGPYFDRYEDYLRALTLVPTDSNEFIIKAAQDVKARGGQEGWPKQEPQVAQLTMPTDSQKPKTIMDPNRGGLNIADISKPMQEPMQIAKPEPAELDVAKPKSTSRGRMSPAIRSRVGKK